MAEPARRNADGPAPDDPERRPDPRAAVWAPVARALVTEIHACGLAVSELARNPDAPAALHMTRSVLAALEALGEAARGWQADEAALEVERKRGRAEGRAACKAGRCRLAVIDGGRAG